jgi:predicted methyltransferase
MTFRKISERYLVAIIFALAVYQMTPDLVTSAFAAESTLAKPKDRAESIHAIVSHLGSDKGSVVADIGAGGGRDTWVFAKIVGETGTVFAEEITENKVKSLESEAEKKGFRQVHAVLGCSSDPCLPPNSIDLAFMCYVYHHFAKPREMLRGIWRGLKPGGHLVVVDRRLGTLRDWVPRHLREKKHFWIAETTVVREAREEGFVFTCCAEQCWHEKDHFALIFQRPEKLETPGRDPDPFRSISMEKSRHLFLPLGRPYRQPVFVALGEARKLMAPILENSSGKGLEIILEEWATQKEERPPLPSDVSLPSVLTENGDPHLGAKQIDVIFFLDSYHLLFHGKTLLAKIHEKLMPAGCVYILDRRAEKTLSRRETSHRRMIRPETVKQEMAEAGFYLWFSGPRITPDRFLLVFGKVRPKKVPPDDDPFVSGPEIPHKPGYWLKNNYWRLRGMRAADGSLFHLKTGGNKKSIDRVPSSPPDQEIWRIHDDKLMLYFEKRQEVYLLTHGESVGGTSGHSTQ